MYGIIRTIFGLICFSVVFVLLKYKKIRLNKVKLTFTIVAISLLVILFMFLPFENLFVDFTSPDRAFNYCYSNSEYIMSVEGESSDLLIGKENGTYKYIIFPKTENGWKLPSFLNIDLKSKKIIDSKNCIVTIRKNKKTNDYFVMIMGLNNMISKPFDSCNSDFIIDTSSSNKRIYHAKINDFNENYWVNIDNEQFYFGNAFN